MKGRICNEMSSYSNQFIGIVHRRSFFGVGWGGVRGGVGRGDKAHIKWKFDSYKKHTIQFFKTNLYNRLEVDVSVYIKNDRGNQSIIYL